MPPHVQENVRRNWFFQDHRFLKEVFAVALPIAFQLLITTSINITDTVMISSLGSAEIAAVGLVNQFVFFFQIICFGIGGAGAVFIAQHFGNRDERKVRIYLSITMQAAVFLSILFSIGAIFFPDRIMGLIVQDPRVQDLGMRYLRPVGFTFPFFAVSFSLITVLRGVNRAREPLMVSIISFATNVAFNYIFIFGKFGAPQLGVVGAAVGTVISRVVETVILIILVSHHRPGFMDVRPLELFHWHGEEVRRCLPAATPIVLAETSWSFGQLVQAVAFAMAGKEVVAAVQLTNSINNIFFIIIDALCSSASVLLGQRLGAGELKRAETMATYFMQFVTVVSAISAAILILFPDALMMLFSGIEPVVAERSHNLLLIRGVAAPFRFWNSMIFVGILRAGGETKWSFYFELMSIWLYAVPIAFLGVAVFHWPFELTFFLVSAEEMVKMLFIYPLYRKKTWVRNLTR